MKKVLIVATVQSHISQFHKPFVELLHSNGFFVDAAGRNNLAEKNGLKLDFVDRVFDIPFSRSPLNKNNFVAYKMLKKIINNEKYDIIHCNTPMGGVLTRLASRKSRKSGTKVIYMAHGFHFYKGAPLKNWIVYYPIEKILSTKTDVLITITDEDYLFAKKHFRCAVFHIHGVGVKTDKFKLANYAYIRNFKKNLGLDNKIVLLCTGELNKNKNQIMLINSMKKVNEKQDNIVLLLAGNGPEEQVLKQRIIELGLSNSVQLIGYRTDLEKYVWASDIIVSVSKREGLPVNILEAMLCKKPVIVSNNRGHRELVKNDENGIILKDNSEDELSNAILKLSNDDGLQNAYGECAYKKVQEYTDINVKKELSDLLIEII